MSKTKSITVSAIHSRISTRTQSNLDWNNPRRPAVTPRREWHSVMRQFGPIWMHERVIGFEPGSNGAVIQ